MEKRREHITFKQANVFLLFTTDEKAEACCWISAKGMTLSRSESGGIQSISTRKKTGFPQAGHSTVTFFKGGTFRLTSLFFKPSGRSRHPFFC